MNMNMNQALCIIADSGSTGVKGNLSHKNDNRFLEHLKFNFVCAKFE
jgi:hypothetical protein